MATTPLLNKAIERLTGYMGTVSSDHAYIHLGKAYSISQNFTLTDSAVRAFIFKTPAISLNKYIHWRPTVLSTTEGGILYEFNEGATYTGGSSVSSVIWNRNRVLSANTSLSTVTAGVTITDAGTPLVSTIIGAGGNPAQASGGSNNGDEHEIVLKADTQYMLRYTNQSTSDTVVAVSLFWYEEGRGV